MRRSRVCYRIFEITWITFLTRRNRNWPHGFVLLVRRCMWHPRSRRAPPQCTSTRSQCPGQILPNSPTCGFGQGISGYCAVLTGTWCQRGLAGRPGEGQTVLCMASSRGYAEVVRSLLDHGADPDAECLDWDDNLNSWMLCETGPTTLPGYYFGTARISMH